MTAGALRIRLATLADIPAMHRIRLAVSENRLADPPSVAEQCYAPYVTASSAWVACIDDVSCGFAILDVPDRSVWALFVDPDAEGSGIGRALHDQVIGWSREHQLGRLTLTTAPGTRAEHFYRAHGWIETGIATNGDLYFERDL